LERQRTLKIQQILSGMAGLRNQTRGEIQTLRGQKALSIDEYIDNLLANKAQGDSAGQQLAYDMDLEERRLAQDAEQFEATLGLNQMGLDNQMAIEELLRMINDPNWTPGGGWTPGSKDNGVI
jgi:hypothetical protein